MSPVLLATWKTTRVDELTGDRTWGCVEPAGLELNLPAGLLWFLWLSCDLHSAYFHSREEILWERLPTKQCRSQKGGGHALFGTCSFCFPLSVTSLFHDLGLCCSDDLGCCAFMLVYRVALAQFFYQVCSLGSLGTAVCSCCIPLQWEISHLIFFFF